MLPAPGTGLISRYFTGDAEADAIARGEVTVDFFATPMMDAFDVRWRIQNALRMLGLEQWGMPYGETIDADRMVRIDAALAAKEDVLGAQASKIANWQDIFTHDFIDNIPQEFAAHPVATIFDLFNASAITYQAHTTDCVLANFVSGYASGLTNTERDYRP